MNTETLIGIIASTLTALSLLPQLCKILKEKKAENVSIGMLVALLTGLIFWIIYGCMIQDIIIIISNAASLIINIVTLCLTLKFKQK